MDAEGNTYQLRKLRDGSMHRVVKNFPTSGELDAALGSCGTQGKLTTWEYYWAFDMWRLGPDLTFDRTRRCGAHASVYGRSGRPINLAS